MAEQWPFKPLVESSSLSSLTNYLSKLLVVRPVEGLYSSLSSLTNYLPKLLVVCPVEASATEEDSHPSAFITFFEYGAGRHQRYNRSGQRRRAG